MTAAVVLTAGSLAAAAAVVVVGARMGVEGLARPVFGGLIGPLVAVVATWIAVVRGYRRNPAGLTGMMVKAFLVKAVFFVAYVVVMIKVAGFPAQAFGISFVTCFIALYAVEAALFARLFRDGLKGAR
jgi:uncharacterized paraquat-inducible protein A